MGTFDRSVLVRLAAVVAGGKHAVMTAQLVIASGEIPLRIGVEVFVGGGQGIAAVFGRRAAQLPQRILQVLRKGGKALPAQHDSRMLPATRRQAEVVEAIGQGLAGNGDLETVAYREIRQALPTGLMMLREEDLLLAAVQCPPAGDPAFERPPDRIGHGFLAKLVLERLEDRDGNDALDLEQFLDARPEWLKRICAGAPMALLLLLGGKLRIVLDPACAAFTDTGFGRCDGLGVLATMGHEKKYLLIRNVVARHRKPIVLCSMSVPIPPPATAPISPPKEEEKDRHRLSGPLSGRGCAPPYDQPRQPILPAIIVAAQPAIVVVATHLEKQSVRLSLS